MTKKVDLAGTGIRITAAIAIAVPMAFVAGLVVSRQLHPSPQDLWSLLGNAVGALTAIGGAASLYFFQRWHEGRRTVRVLNQLIDEYADHLVAASQALRGGKLEEGKGRVHGAVDAVEALNATLARLTDPSVAVAHLQVTLSILRVNVLRDFAERLETNPDIATEFLVGMAVAARRLQDRLIEDSR